MYTDTRIHPYTHAYIHAYLHEQYLIMHIHACINRDVYYTYKNAPEHACLCGYINVYIVLSFSNEVSSGKNVWSTGGQRVRVDIQRHIRLVQMHENQRKKRTHTTWYQRSIYNTPGAPTMSCWCQSGNRNIFPYPSSICACPWLANIITVIIIVVIIGSFSRR